MINNTKKFSATAASRQKSFSLYEDQFSLQNVGLKRRRKKRVGTKISSNWIAETQSENFEMVRFFLLHSVHNLLIIDAECRSFKETDNAFPFKLCKEIEMIYLIKSLFYIKNSNEFRGRRGSILKLGSKQFSIEFWKWKLMANIM